MIAFTRLDARVPTLFWRRLRTKSCLNTWLRNGIVAGDIMHQLFRYNTARHRVHFNTIAQLE